MIPFLIAALKIVLIDVLLAGDNAVVIAMAVRSLPVPQRRTGTLVGAGLAIGLRIVLTFFAARILNLEFFKLIGGLLVAWIAVKLLTDSDHDPESEDPAGTLGQAIWMILVADITMSTDNILAVAATSNGNIALLIAGLGLSISFVVFMSGFLSRVMDRYPVVIWVGAAILGQVGGDMMATDPWVDAWLKRISPAPHLVQVAVEAGMAILVLLVGFAIRKKRKKTRRDDV
jgi:YjbE family integral membrane protein